MKPKAGSLRKAGRPKPAMWNSRLPMEWMDPMSWRLPSGKALAEFALQAGFLAPLMLGAPKAKRKKPASAGVEESTAQRSAAAVEQRLREGPEASGTFRETR